MNVVLLNDSKEPRVRSSDDVKVLECGCASNDRLWLQMCHPHYDEWRARHVAARDAYKHPNNLDLIS